MGGDNKDKVFIYIERTSLSLLPRQKTFSDEAHLSVLLTSQAVGPTDGPTSGGIF